MSNSEIAMHIICIGENYSYLYWIYFQFFNNYQLSVKVVMSEYAQFFSNPQEESHFFEEHNPFLFDQEIKQSPVFPHQQQKKLIIETNYIQLDRSDIVQKQRANNSINISPQLRQKYVKTFKGDTTETMELHHNFKTILTNWLKDLIILKMLNKGQIERCVIFAKSVPSFQSVFILFTSPQQNLVLKTQVLKYCGSKNAIQKILESKVRMEQKIVMLKYIERLRISIQRPAKNRKWKNKMINII